MKKGVVISNNNVDFSLIKEIGGGGSGVVWKAQANDNNYAIKFINSTDNNKVERFIKELEFCKNNQNKNIVSIIADGEFKGKLYYIMPLYPKTLRDVINEEKDADVLVKFIFQLCNSVSFIHKHKEGVIHRDIKPENILIDVKKLVLADFGIAHFNDSSLTKKGDLLANRNYLAPEQKVKNNANNIEKSADIYALGLIVNECFTKQNLAGSSFRIIADDYPLYYKFDTLVSNMIKQNAKERFSIDTIIAELKFIYGNIKQNLQEIVEGLLSVNYPQNISKRTLSKIIKRASEDLLFAKTVFENKSVEEIGKYNHNWHMKISYTVDSFLFNLYMQEKIYKVCKRKFDDESKSGYHILLNLSDNEEHKQIFQQLKNILAQYPLNNGYEKRFDLSGRILKYFTSCCDYHCQEILWNVQSEHFLRQARELLLNAPVLWIVSSLKDAIRENMGLLSDFNLTEHIQINWDRTQYFVSNDDETELFESFYIDEENKANEILSELKKQWKIIYNRIDGEIYSIKFRSYKQFDRFRKYALQLSKPYYIFEGDVLDIVNHYDYANGIVEIKLGRIFDIPNTLAKILGLRNDY
ncbi:MAG TPA: hypothetical protein DCG75_02875 [Bacteroidales bacterium]|nr:hypothetical protein [Bacteroidales bacterium]